MWSPTVGKEEPSSWTLDGEVSVFERTRKKNKIDIVCVAVLEGKLEEGKLVEEP